MITLYSHNIGFEKITEILKKELPNATITTEKQEGSDVVHVELKGSLFKPGKKFRINYRQREQPSFELPMETTCPVATNLKGMLGFVSRFKATNEKVKDLLLHKIQTLNCEFSVLPEKGEVPEMKRLVQTIATNFDAVLFAQPDTIFSKADGYHFLDKELKLILDAAGNTEVNDLTVTIDPLYFDVAQDNLKPDQTERKKSTEEMLEANGVPFAKTLPCIVSEAECKLRSPKEIAQRAMVMSLTNLVAFGHVEGQEGIEFLQKRGLWEYTSPGEKEFLANPTDELKNQHTWKCECIWTLMWALGKVDELGAPNEMCALDNIPTEFYPIPNGNDPNEFINSVTGMRSAAEILDANDLYYRLDWACVDARIKNKEMDAVHPGVVYERHYALNWLINYRNQEWDDVSCDT